MDYLGIIGTEDAKVRQWEAERKDALAVRTKHMKSKETKVLTAVATSLLALFVR